MTDTDTRTAWVRYDAVHAAREKAAADFGATIAQDTWDALDDRLAATGELITVDGVRYVLVDGNAIDDFDAEDVLTD